MRLASNAALIVVDVQKGFENSTFWGPNYNVDADVNIAMLIDFWQGSGRPIVVVRHDSTNPKSPLHPSNDGALKPYVEVAEQRLLVTKNVNSAFYGDPDLHAWLQKQAIKQIVIVGIQTNMCCETTARMGGNLGYDVVFVPDATDTFDLAGPDGSITLAADLASTTVTNLHGGGFARIASTQDLLRL